MGTLLLAYAMRNLGSASMSAGALCFWSFWWVGLYLFTLFHYFLGQQFVCDIGVNKCRPPTKWSVIFKALVSNFFNRSATVILMTICFGHLQRKRQHCIRSWSTTYSVSSALSQKNDTYHVKQINIIFVQKLPRISDHCMFICA